MVPLSSVSFSISISFIAFFAGFLYCFAVFFHGKKCFFTFFVILRRWRDQTFWLGWMRSLMLLKPVDLYVFFTIYLISGYKPRAKLTKQVSNLYFARYGIIG